MAYISIIIQKGMVFTLQRNIKQIKNIEEAPTSVLASEYELLRPTLLPIPLILPWDLKWSTAP